jgi:hypothetical protein
MFRDSAGKAEILDTIGTNTPTWIIEHDNGHGDPRCHSDDTEDDNQDASSW